MVDELKEQVRLRAGTGRLGAWSRSRHGARSSVTPQRGPQCAKGDSGTELGSTWPWVAPGHGTQGVPGALGLLWGCCSLSAAPSRVPAWDILVGLVLARLGPRVRNGAALGKPLGRTWSHCRAGWESPPAAAPEHRPELCRRWALHGVMLLRAEPRLPRAPSVLRVPALPGVLRAQGVWGALTQGCEVSARRSAPWSCSTSGPGAAPEEPRAAKSQSQAPPPYTSCPQGCWFESLAPALLPGGAKPHPRLGGQLPAMGTAWQGDPSGYGRSLEHCSTVSSRVM